MENELQGTSIKSCCKNPKIIMVFVGMILLAGIIIVSIIRDRIVNPNMNQVTINGEGKVSYQPDTANIVLGTQIDKAPTAEEALRLLNEKINKTVEAVKALGVEEGDIKTKNYSLLPQYDYRDGISTVAGYGASQQLEIKARGADKKTGIVSQIVSAASSAGINQVIGISFETSSLNDLKQQARILAIEDAKSKAGALARAAGIRRLGKVTGWYENVIQSPDMQVGYGLGGMGAGEKDMLSSRPVAVPQIPSGNQEIVISVGLNYEVK
jgi:uncharacterized protein YggE